MTAGTLQQMFEITNSSGYLGGNGIDLLCGLGLNTEIDRIVINWPSGLIQELTKVNANRTVVVEENNGLKHEFPRTFTIHEMDHYQSDIS